MLLSVEDCYGVEEEKGGRRKKERKKERRQLGQMLHGNARLLIGCRDSAGYLTFNLVNQGFWRHRLTSSSPSLKLWR